MRKVRLMGVLATSLVGLCQQSFATFARVESMGKSATYFMDDVSIFQNPANMNIFPNFLIGEMGSYRQSKIDSTAIGEINGNNGQNFNNPRYNRDPENSWFGGIFSYSISKNKEMGSFYPQISIGGALNRIDEELFSLVPDFANGYAIPDPATNFDGFLGFTLANGGMIGSHIYVAMQEGANLHNGQILGGDSGISDNINIYGLRFDLGLNWPLARNIDGEVSFGFASLAYGPSDVDPNYSLFIKTRLFSTLEIINGELVPILNYSSIKAPGQELNDFEAGLGVNVSLDRGFFWLGVTGLWNQLDQIGMTSTNGSMRYNSYGSNKNLVTNTGARIAFGIERNIWWDWLVLRVGGQKEISYREVQDSERTYNYTYTNPVADTSPGDHVGFGLGINVEEKLKIDATVAEDVVFTAGNLFSGPQHHVLSRISATYSF